MVDPHASSTRDDTYHHHHHHHHPHPHHYHSAKQSLSAFEYNNSRDVRGADGGITNTNAYTTAQRTTDRVPQIPDGFKASRAFDALDVWKTSVNHSNNYRNDNKASEMSSFHHRTNTNSNVPLPLPKFIRPAVSTQNNSDRSHNMYRQTRNTDVSELFLAEAKAAQAKLDMEIDGNSSLDSFNTYEAMIDRPPLSRQYSSSSVDAVGPIENDTKASKNQLITLQLVDDTVQIATTPSNSRQQEKRQQQLLSKSPRTNRYSNEIDDDDDDDVDDHHHLHHHHHYRSYRKPIGLTYALRKTDSGSTFQSLDGLSNSSPLIRHESKKKHQRRSSTHNKSKRKKRSSQPSVSSSTIFTSSINTSFMKCYPTDEFDYSNRFICFNAPTCLPIDHLKESFENYRHRYYASTAYQNQHHNASGSVGSTFDDDKFINYNSNNSPSKQREGPEHSPSPSPTRVNVHQQHLLHIREQQQKVTEFDSPEISTTVISSTINIPHPKKIKSKRVQFATTLVTKVNYRPYTPQSEIAVLYFQEEELEELECDRETVSGDQFECQFDEMALAVHIAYQQINPSDE